jgi:hypothetical protein
VSAPSATRVPAGAVGGAANEAGGGFRAGLAAYVAVHVMRGQPFADLDLLPEQAVPISLQLEADVAVDDLQVVLAGGSAFIQAKRRLDFRKSGPASIAAVVKQWIALAEERQIDPSRERLVAAAAEASGAARALGAALRRRRRRLAGAPMKGETDALAQLEALLAGVAQRERILDAATVWIADLEEGDGIAARLAQALLEPGIVLPGQGNRAWQALREGARELARKRYGATLEDLIALLRAVPLTLTADATGYASARAEERRATLGAYRRRVRARGEAIDLRGLGASLPPMQLADVDARIEVVPTEPGQAPGGGNSSPIGGLPWALRRRGRSLLLGLPGSGKSVALRSAAAHYAARESWPLPIVVRLDRLARLLPVRGFGEALLEVAFQEEPVEEQASLREAAIQALRDGDAALFLDALDETRQLRGLIVARIEAELAQFDRAVELLLSTRDVAYADAHTLGFAELRLIAPGNPKETAQAILSATAEQRHMPGEEAQRWVQERADWIEQRLGNDRALGETPLIIVLLALLACDRPAADLPRSRGAVLALVVNDVVARWEAGLRLQEKPVSLGSLQGQDAVQAAQDAFRIIGDLVLAEVDPTREQVLDTLTKGLRRDYSLAPALMRSVAADALALWDEAGVFVIVGGTTRVQARIRLFAELACALTVCRETESRQRRWLAGALGCPEQREPVLLAVGLSATIAEALLDTVAKDPQPAALLDLLIEALQQGATPGAEPIARLLERLLEPDGPGAEDHRRRAMTMIELPVAAAAQPRALEFLSRLQGPSRLFARAISTQTWSRTDPDVEEDLLAVLRFERPRDVQSEPGSEDVLVLTTPDADYQRAVELAVERLLEPGRIDVAELVGRRLHRGVSYVVAARLRRALIEAGFESIVTREARDQRRKWKGINWPFLSEREEDEVDIRLIEIVRDCASQPSTLDRIPRRRLDRLASLISSTGFQDAPAGEAIKGVLKESQRLGMLLRTSALLGGLDLADVAAEAQELLTVFAEEGAERLAPMAMLGDKPPRLRSGRWERIPDQSDTARSLARAVASPYAWLGRVAVNCLAGAPPPACDIALRELRSQLPDSAGRLEFLLALAILVLDDRELTPFSADPRPMVRRAAAYRWRRGGSTSRDVLAMLVGDPDAGVSLEAVRSVRDAGLGAQLRPQLEQALREPRGWECFWCGEENPSKRFNCAECETSRPDLEREINAVVADLEDGDDHASIQAGVKASR